MILDLNQAELDVLAEALKGFAAATLEFRSIPARQEFFQVFDKLSAKVLSSQRGADWNAWLGLYIYEGKEASKS